MTGLAGLGPSVRPLHPPHPALRLLGPQSDLSTDDAEGKWEVQEGTSQARGWGEEASAAWEAPSAEVAGKWPGRPVFWIR